MAKRKQKRTSSSKGFRRDAATDQLIRAGLELHQQGRVEEAASRFEEALSRAPEDPDALHLLGALNLQRGQPALAVTLIESALRVVPKNADYHNNLGNALLALDRLDEAAQAFRSASKLRSHDAEAHINLGSTLGRMDHHEEALEALQRGLRLDPNSVDGHCNLGVSLQALGRLDDSIGAFRTALGINPRHTLTRKNLVLALEREEIGRYQRRGEILAELETANEGIAPEQRDDLGHLYRPLIARWHFPMLNDAPRNAAFEGAIKRAVRPESVVLDIGTGSGLLAMMAARAGARHVYACEMVAPLAERARTIVRRNDLQDRITIIAKASTDLVPGTDLPEPATVLVTETVDAGLLGEGTILSIEHARRELLAPGATIIPTGASIHAVLVESSELRNMDRVGEVQGFDLSDFNAFSSSPRYFQVAMHNFQYRPLSAVFDVFDFDFGQPGIGEREAVYQVPAVTSGQLDALVFWFTLRLDEASSLQTGPFDQGSHWEQAVVVSKSSMSVQTGDSLAVRVKHDAKSITFTLP